MEASAKQSDSSQDLARSSDGSSGVLDEVTKRLESKVFVKEGTEQSDSRLMDFESVNYYAKRRDVGRGRRLRGMISNDIAPEDIEEMRQIFDVFDADHNGQINASEIRHIIRSLGQSTTEAEIMDIMFAIDENDDRVIEFPEFLSLIGERLQEIKKNDQMEKVFRVFDNDSTGSINADNLHRMFAIFGQNFTEKEIEEILQAADNDNDGKVGYDDFVKMMKEQ